MRYILFSILAVLISSCVQDQKPVEKDDLNIQHEELSLEAKVEQLKLELQQKDSMINESLMFFGEIQRNLEEINIHQDKIRDYSNDPELAGNKKEWILEEIKQINFLREQNAKKVRRMQEQLKANNIQIKALEDMVGNLTREIKWKDEQISLLQEELSALDQEYAALFDAYQEQSIILDELQETFNSVYYAFGSEEELLENGVIEETKKGFIGIGKKVNLKGDFNDEYFTRADIHQLNEIIIHGEVEKIITPHPSDAYKLKKQGNKTVLRILSPSAFWKVSKYLVIITK